MFLCRWLPQRGEAFPLAGIIARVAGEVLPTGLPSRNAKGSQNRALSPPRCLGKLDSTQISNHLSRRPSLSASWTTNSYGEWGRFRGAGQPTFEAFFISRYRKIRKAAPTLMREHVSHRPMPATACSASLRCHRSRYSRPSRSPGDDAEAVFVLVALRGFAQLSGNQCQRTHSEHENACG